MLSQVKTHRHRVRHRRCFAGCQTTQIGAPSADFDGVYAFKYTCDDGPGYGMSSKWDGSQFIVKGGAVSNNRGRGAFFTVSDRSRVDKTGAIYIHGSRANPSGKDPKDFTIQGEPSRQGPKIQRFHKAAKPLPAPSAGLMARPPCARAWPPLSLRRNSPRQVAGRPRERARISLCREQKHDDRFRPFGR